VGLFLATGGGHLKTARKDRGIESFFIVKGIKRRRTFGEKGPNNAGVELIVRYVAVNSRERKRKKKA